MNHPARIEMHKICKFFPDNGVKALQNVDFSLRSGELLAILGENGAGKSTLMQILAGYIKKDRGTIKVDGRERNFSGPMAAISAGIGMVKQKPSLIPALKVWEDCVLGNECAGLFFPYRKKARAEVEKVAEEHQIQIDLDEKTENLSVRECQLAGILSLLFHNARFLIFDEPTAVLTEEDTKKLFKLWESLASKGKGIVLISHKIEEVIRIAGSITVLRRGQNAGTLKREDFNREKILELMFGKPAGNSGESGGVSEKIIPLSFAVKAPETPEHRLAVLKVGNITVESPEHPFIRELSFEVKAGEIFGITGIKESGVETAELALPGFLGTSGGKIELGGRDITNRGNSGFRQAGGVYLSAGRHKIRENEYIVSSDPDLSIRENLLVHSHKRLLRGGLAGRLGFFNKKETGLWLKETLESADLHISGREKAFTLSGGMFQRLIGVREFRENPKLAVFTEPGRGLDKQRRERFYSFLRTKTEKGAGIILFFSNLDELIEVSDRILVLCNGKCAGIFDIFNYFNRPSGFNHHVQEEIKNEINKAMAGD